MEIVVFDKTAGSKKLAKELAAVLSKGVIKEETLVVITKEKDSSLVVKFKFAGFEKKKAILKVHAKIKDTFESLVLRDDRVNASMTLDEDEKFIEKIVYKEKKENALIPVSMPGLKSEMYFLVSTISDVFVKAEEEIDDEEDDKEVDEKKIGEDLEENEE